MAILNGINIKGTEEVHQLDYDKAIANKPTLVKSFNDLEDKPFYSEQGEVDILPKAGYTFFIEDGMGMYVHDTPFNIVENETYYVELDGTIYECVCNYFSEDNAYYVGNSMMFGLEDTEEPFGIVNDLNNNEYIIIAFDELTTHNIRIYQSREVIKHLDSKFIKDMYYTEGGKYIIFEEQDVQFVAMSENGLQGYGYIQNPSIDIDGSLDCIVEWDGVGYVCTPMVDSDTEESREIYVGNLGFLGEDDTGEPFLILDGLQMTVFATTSEGTHKVCVYQENEIVKQIPSKYVDSYTKAQINEMLGIYIEEVNALLGGDE